MATIDGGNQQLTFRQDMRIRRAVDFEAVYRASVRHNVEPLLIYARPNQLPHSRLGMALPKRIGKATVRNRTRRRLREAFRLLQHDLPKGYDFVINVRQHKVMKTAAYQRLILEAARSLDTRWIKKQQTIDQPSRPAH